MVAETSPIPPWAGGVTPPSVMHTHSPRVPSSTTDGYAECTLNASDKDELEPRHFHQLFCRLRLTQRVPQALQSLVRRDLGHIDNLSSLTVPNLLSTHRPTREEETKGHCATTVPQDPETAPGGRNQQSAPRCALDPGPVAPAAHPDREPGNPSQAPHLRRKVRSTRC